MKLVPKIFVHMDDYSSQITFSRVKSIFGYAIPLSNYNTTLIHKPKDI